MKYLKKAFSLHGKFPATFSHCRDSLDWRRASSTALMKRFRSRLMWNPWQHVDRHSMKFQVFCFFEHLSVESVFKGGCYHIWILTPLLNNVQIRGQFPNVHIFLVYLFHHSLNALPSIFTGFQVEVTCWPPWTFCPWKDPRAPLKAPWNDRPLRRMHCIMKMIS